MSDQKEPLNQEKLDLLLKKEDKQLRRSAFEYWLSLGPERSTAAVAEHFKVGPYNAESREQPPATQKARSVRR